jgi:AraC-like DNA-binding protein/tetratricopeptide (TPR) repeat protein
MRYLFLFLLVLISHLTLGQNRELDSLYVALKEHPQEDTIRAEILHKICYYENETHPEKSKALAEEILSISKKINYTKGESFAFRYQAEYYFTKGDHGQATKYAYEMLRAAEKSSYKKGMGVAYDILGRTQQEEGDLENAKISFLEEIAIFQKLNYKAELGLGYGNLAGLYFLQSKYDQATEYHTKSIEIMKELSDKNGLAIAYANLGLLFAMKKEYDKAFHFLDLGTLLSKELDSRSQMATGYSNMGEVCIYTKEYDKAEFYLLQSIGISKDIDFKTQLLETYGTLALLEQKRGRVKDMIKYFDLKYACRDSIYTEEKAKQFAEMQTIYETEKKNQTIQLLERDKRIQQLWTNVFIAAFIFLTILFAIVYFFQRYRARKNRRIFNLEIDSLIAQRNELSEKYKDALITGSEKKVESYDQLLLKKAIEIVENNMSDTLFGVEQMADKIGMSRTSLNRKLKTITGFPPSELIRNIRLRKAASLLRSQVNSVTQISIAVGFEDQSYFSKSFKKQFGVPPSEYLESTKLAEALS